MSNEPTVPETEEPKPKAARPVKLKGLRRASEQQLGVGHREVKMLRPVCTICAPQPQLAEPEWWKTCSHEPYIGEKGETFTENIYESDPDGGRVIAGVNSKTVLRPWPNFVPVPLVTRISSGMGPEYKRRLNGFISPEELRCEAYPNGIAPCCEFYGCYWQDDLKTYSSGTFCQEVEATVVYEDAHGIAQEVHNKEIRADQFEASRAKVKAAW